MTWKIELCALGAAALITAAGTSMAYSSTVEPSDPATAFTQSDFEKLSHAYEKDGVDCAAGMPEKGLCFQPSPLERKIVVGEKMPQDVPTLPARMKTLIVTDRKSPELATFRYGTTLVLVNKTSGIVADRISLQANTFAEARASQYASADTNTSLLN